jgi:uncharacterized protein YjbI with pentapeptide repeats
MTWKKEKHPAIAEGWEDRDTNKDYWWNRTNKTNPCPICLMEDKENKDLYTYIEIESTISGEAFWLRPENKNKAHCWKHLEDAIKQRYYEWLIKILKTKPAGRGFNLKAFDLPIAEKTRVETSVIHFIRAHLEGALLSNSRLEKVNFSFAHLEQAILEDAHMEEANFYCAHLDNAIIINTHIEKTDFSFACLNGANLKESHLEGARLPFARLKGASLKQTHLERTSFYFANLEDAQFDHAHLEDTNFEHARLVRVRLYKAYLESTSFYDVRLEGADFSYAFFAEGMMGFEKTAFTKGSEKLGEQDLEGIKLKNVSSIDFSAVTYNKENKYFLCISHHPIHWIIFVFRWLYFKINNKDNVKLGSAICPQHTKTKFLFVDTRYVDWSKNRQLEKDIVHQQYLDQLYGKINVLGKSLFFLWWLFTNCGQSLLRWLFWCAVFILGFAIIFYNYPLVTEQFHLTGQTEFGYISLTDGDLPRPDFLTAIYFSITTFTTFGLGDVIPCCRWGKVVVSIEMLLGFTMLGGLIALFANKFVRHE